MEGVREQQVGAPCERARPEGTGQRAASWEASSPLVQLEYVVMEQLWVQEEVEQPQISVELVLEGDMSKETWTREQVKESPKHAISLGQRTLHKREEYRTSNMEEESLQDRTFGRAIGPPIGPPITGPPPPAPPFAIPPIVQKMYNRLDMKPQSQRCFDVMTGASEHNRAFWPVTSTSAVSG